jgi:FtsP/CotA-like multicopper oxidase with cupredoxin domain
MMAIAPALGSAAFASATQQQAAIVLSATGVACRVDGKQALMQALETGHATRVRFAATGGNVFAVHVSGAELQIVGADGFEVTPVTAHGFLIGGTETYDAIITPIGSFAMSAVVAEPVALNSENMLRYADLKSAATLPTIKPEREVLTTISSGMRDHTWSYAGQVYFEQSDVLTLDEDEQVRIALHNDSLITKAMHFSGMRFQIAGHANAAYKQSLVLMPNETIALDVLVDSVTARSLTEEQSKLTRAIAVRPAYQHHPSFLA